MVPVKEAIQTGAWFLFSSNDDDFHFRLRVLSFTKLNLSLIDNPQEIKNNDIGADWWLMEIEAVNLNKTNIRGHNMIPTILLVDQDGFEFKVATDSHLTRFSEFSKQSGLNRFHVFSEFSPKIKAVGAISFRLPDDDGAQFFLAMKEGTVREA